MTNLYYKPSGKVTLWGVALGLVGGFVAGLLLAYAYSYLIAYIPFIYLNFLITIGYAVLLGTCTGFLLRFGKVRNNWVCAAVALVVAAASLYLAWAVWLSVMLWKADLSVSVMDLAQQPGFVWELVQEINKTGAWTIGSLHAGQGIAVSGVVLWLVWVAEALIVLVGSVIGATAAMSSDPFCESCQSWCRHTKELMLLETGNPDELKRRVEAKDFDSLKSLEPKKPGQEDWFKIDICECPKCGHTNTLSLINERWVVDNKGKQSKKGTPVVDKLLVSKSDINRLRQVSQGVGQAQAQK
jgi:hypothetical protein